jgi:hypothetical protein
MKYQYAPVVQDYKYSCLDELRVELFEILKKEKEVNGKYSWVTVLMGTKRANELLDMLLKSEFDGIDMVVSADFSFEDMESAMTADIVALTICSDGDIIADAYDPNVYCGFDFLAIDKSLADYEEITKRFRSGDDYSKHILRFTI